MGVCLEPVMLTVDEWIWKDAVLTVDDGSWAAMLTIDWGSGGCSANSSYGELGLLCLQ